MLEKNTRYQLYSFNVFLILKNVKKKEQIPTGNVGMWACGHVPTFEEGYRGAHI